MTAHRVVVDTAGRAGRARSIAVWTIVAVAGGVGWAVLALSRGESVSALWMLVAGLGSYAIAFRFYARFLADRVLRVDDTRATPAERLANDVDFQPTDRRVLFGHHFAAIAGAGPLVGPVLAAQMGYLPGTIWIVVGVIFAGAVQDMITLFFSVRRDGRSLGQLARDEIGPVGGVAALVAVFAIMIILLAVLALVVVNALAHSPWGTFSIAMTIPIAVFMGLYLRAIRPGRVAEATALGVAALFAAIVAGRWVQQSGLASAFTLSPKALVICLVGYGFVASVLPVWMLLAPRDYLSTFMKIGTIGLLAVGVVVELPVLQAEAVSPFATRGNGPVFAGSLFPFLFITIACGALSGFHALVACGTTPKMIQKESQIRLVGYGAMLVESFVALMALIAAAALTPGLYFAMNAPAGVVGQTAASASAAVAHLGFTITPDSLDAAARAVGEPTLVARTGGAPTLAVGMSHILSGAFGGGGLAAFWYHFAIMFEALFILTTVDAGTRVGRFMLQDTLGNLWKPIGRVSWWPGVWLSSALVVGAWGYFLWAGATDPLGGINQLFPLFGMANQLLAAIALTVATTLLVKSGRVRWAWVTGAPLAWDVAVTFTAAWQKVFSADPRVGFFAQRDRYADALDDGRILAPAKNIGDMHRVVLNSTVDGVLAMLFALLALVVLVDAARVCAQTIRRRVPVPTTEVAHVPSRIAVPRGRSASEAAVPPTAHSGVTTASKADSPL
ncbi:carbon starvation protein [Parafrankia irregularis]|uniref:Carbon starvation protein n=1 Tax=Parafrankia irregularis TaxID=795642 RepID=A0A0S4QUS0_9ACTN|nr:MULTISPECIES: carbon starvation CstA family protein [Parafrankia]MBE3202437.1 carbon starvation protein A [Parafrankia sp. CH37]CUU58953.1 carbon starvation protein [Parafrankia irregularis]